MSIPIKLTTKSACRVAGIDPARLNEHVSSGYFPCAPKTVPGRVRGFDPYDMLALKMFVQLMDEGMGGKAAGEMACRVSEAARHNPDAPTITAMKLFTGMQPVMVGEVDKTEVFPAPRDWETRTGLGGIPIREARTFNVKVTLELLAREIEEELSTRGEPD